MIEKFIKGRVFVFIDAANVLYSQKTLGWKIDYQKLKQYFNQECDLRGLYFYTGKMSDYSKQIKFLKKMNDYGYSVKTKEVKFIRIRENVYERKGNLDIELVIDVLKNIDNFDTCVLMSGDSDFAPLLDEIKTKGKLVIVLSTKGHISKELIERAKYINLKKLKQQISFVDK